MEASSQDDYQSLVAPFQALTSNAHQRGASVQLRCHRLNIAADQVHRLNALVKVLTFQQIRELRSTIEEVDFHCDIIAKLPLEISQLILQYLPLYQIFWARRVSPKWKQILSSAHIENLLLQDWYPKRDVDQSLQTPTGLPAESVASLKAEHIDAYRTGHAFSYARHEWDCFARGLDRDLVAYADGVMAWVDTTGSHFVKLLDFKTGEKWSFMPEARTNVYAIAMSSSMVAALGLARCDVWTFRTGDHYSLRFPSARSEIAVSGESLAIVHVAWLDRASRRAEVVTWRLRDQKTSSFSIIISPKERGHHCMFKMMLDNKGESLLLFDLLLIEPVHSTYQDDESAHFFYIRTSLNGNVLTQGIIDAPDMKGYQLFSGEAVPMEANGHAVICSFVQRQCGEDDLSELILVCYSFQKDALEVRTQVVTGLCVNADTVYDLFVWKDVAFYVANRNNRLGLRVIDLQESTCTEARTDFSVDAQSSHQRKHDDYEPEVLSFGDETFLINVFLQGFYVWCFDTNVRMFNEETSYKEERKSNRERRFLSKQNRKDGSSDDSFTRKSD